MNIFTHVGTVMGQRTVLGQRILKNAHLTQNIVYERYSEKVTQHLYIVQTLPIAGTQHKKLPFN